MFMNFIRKQLNKVSKNIKRAKNKQPNFLMALLTSLILSSVIKISLTGFFGIYFEQAINEINVSNIFSYIFAWAYLKDLLWSSVTFLATLVINFIFQKSRKGIISNNVKEQKKTINNLEKIGYKNVEIVNNKILIFCIFIIPLLVSPILTFYMQSNCKDWLFPVKVTMAVILIFITWKIQSCLSKSKQA